MVAVFTAACTNEQEFIREEASQQVTVSLSAETNYVDEQQPISSMNAVNRTASTAILSRYVVEVYADEACQTPVYVFGSTNHKEQSTPDFQLTLDRTKKYTCLFWADDNLTSIYDVSTLIPIKLRANQLPGEGFYAKVTIDGVSTTQSATMRRAVSKIIVSDKKGVEAGQTLLLKYSQSSTFNLADGTVGTPVNTETSIITTATVADGEVAAFYLLSTSTVERFSLTFNYNSQGEKKVENIPFQANHRTHVKGSITE